MQGETGPGQVPATRVGRPLLSTVRPPLRRALRPSAQPVQLVTSELFYTQVQKVKGLSGLLGTRLNQKSMRSETFQTSSILSSRNKIEPASTSRLMD